jgi:hypothetical protein
VGVFELSEVLPLTCILFSGRVTTKGSTPGLAAYTHHRYAHVRLGGLLKELRRVYVAAAFSPVRTMNHDKYVDLHHLPFS